MRGGAVAGEEVSHACDPLTAPAPGGARSWNWGSGVCGSEALTLVARLVFPTDGAAEDTRHPGPSQTAAPKGTEQPGPGPEEVTGPFPARRLKDDGPKSRARSPQQA